MSVVVWLTKSLNSLGTFILLVYTIPLAFDVGGRDCGLVYIFTPFMETNL
jgi:hypothetical protein